MSTARHRRARPSVWGSPILWAAITAALLGVCAWVILHGPPACPPSIVGPWC